MSDAALSERASRSSWCRLVLPGVMTAAMLAALIGLGNWQMRRLSWKTDLLADIAHAEAAPAVPLPAHPRPFQKISVSGVWLGDRAVLYGDEVRDGRAGPVIGGQLVVPLQLARGGVLLVDRGWVPLAGWQSMAAASNGAASVEGYLHLPEHAGFFSAHDDPANRRFYTLDPQAIARALSLPRVEPFALVALGPAFPDAPIPATALPRPPNDHLQYALTWYGLAATLVAVFAVWARRQFMTQDAPSPR